MHFHAFHILLLGMSLVREYSSSQCTCEEKANTCTFIPCGIPGSNGLPGRDGMEGPKGEKGELGLRGTQGLPGKAGPSGPKGERGSVGERGPTGSNGRQELDHLKTQLRELQAQLKDLQATVSKAQKGAGLRGLQGFPGKAGPQGTKGDQGPQGERGQKGESASEKSTLSDSAFDALQRQVTALEKNIQTLQADISRHQKFFSFRRVKSVGKKTFMSTGTKDSFENGKSMCTKAGGALACPHNHAENTALREILKDSEQAYLGMSDVQTERQISVSEWRTCNLHKLGNWEKGYMEGHSEPLRPA